MSMPVDKDNLEMLRELIGEDLKEILQAYLDSAPDLLIKIEQALQNNDAATLQLNAHSLKGSSANIGATTLPSVCAELEQMAKNNDLSTKANSLFMDIKSSNEQVSQFLQTYMQQF